MNTRLLVSVRSLREARMVARHAVDVIDLKEPRRGSLGAVPGAVAAAVAAEFAGRRLLSLALGELLDAGDALPLPQDLLRQFNYAKIGLARCAAEHDWPQRWQRWAGRLPGHLQPVAVAYADGAAVGAPAPEEVLRRAAPHGAAGMLVDTAIKGQGSLLDWLPLPALRRLLDQAAACGVWVALAGSLDCQSIARVCQLGPQWVAVRGAACRAGREGTISPRRLQQVVAATQHPVGQKIVDRLTDTPDTRQAT